MNITITSVKELGEFAAKIRKEQGLSQEDLAGITGVGRRFISELENGKETAQIGKILVVLGALGIALGASKVWHEQ